MGTTFAPGCCPGSGGGGGGDVTSVFGRTGAVLAQAGDYDTTLVTRSASPTIAGLTCEAALVEVSTSIYAKTVWVAQGHAKATDVRVGLSDYDMLHPFETLGAALAAIALSGETFVCVRIASGYYDESVTVPDGVWIFGEGEDVFLVRTEFLSGGSNGIQNLAFYNDAAFVASAPNQSPIYVENATILRIKDIRANDYFANNLAAQPAALDVREAFVQVDTSQFAAYQTAGGTGVVSTIWCGARTRGTLIATITANASSFIGSTNASKESACAISTTNTAALSTISTTGCSFNGDISSATAEGVAAAFIADSAAGKIVSQGDLCFISSNAISTPLAQCAGYVTTSLTIFNCLISNMCISQSGSATNFGGGVSVGAGSTVRMLGMVWPTRSVTPPRVGITTGTYVHEGVLSTGVRFPAPAADEVISGRTIWVDVNAPLATDTRGALSKYSQAYPFVTIAAAIAASTPSTDTIRVRAGIYVPTATLVLAQNQKIVFEDGASVTDGAGNFMVMSFTDGCVIDGLVINTPSTGGMLGALRFIAVNASNPNPQLKNIRFIGTGDGWGLVCDAGVAGQTVYCNNVRHQSGTLDRVISITTNTAVVLKDCGSDVSAVGTSFAYLGSGGLFFNNLDIYGQYTNGFATDGRSVIGEGFFCQRATNVFLCYPGSNVFVTSCFLQANTFDVTIDDPLDVTTRVQLFGQWDRAKVQAPADWLATGRLLGMQSAQSSIAAPNAIQGALSVGNPESIARVGLSGGLPSQSGISVKRNTNLAAGVWSDITADLTSANPVNLFSATTVGAALYFGADVPFWAVELYLTQTSQFASAAGVFVAEYWSGGGWVQISSMETDQTAPGPTTPPRRRGKALLATLYSMYLRWGAPAALTSTLDGSSKYWLRLSVSGAALTQVPIADYAAWVPSGEQRDSYGYIQYFGAACPNNAVLLRQFKSQAVSQGSGLGSASISLGGLPYSMTFDDSAFANSGTNRTGDSYHLTGDIDTSRLIEVGLHLYRIGGTAGLAVQFELSATVLGPGSDITVSQQITATTLFVVPPNINEIQVCTINIDFMTLNVQDEALIGWVLVRNGTAIGDTFDATIYTVLIRANGYKWRA